MKREWGPGIYQNDITEEIREEYLNWIRVGKTNQEAAEDMFEYYKDYLETEEDYGILTIALADIQWKYGMLLPEIKERALEYINSGIDYKRWNNTRTLEKRKKILTELASRLNSPQPSEKKIKPIKFIRRKWKVGDIIIYKITDRKYKNLDWYDTYVAFKVIGHVKYGAGAGLNPQKYYHKRDVVELYDAYWDHKPTLDEIMQEKLYQEEKDIMFFSEREIKKLNMETLSSPMSSDIENEISLIGIPFINAGNIDYVMNAILNKRKRNDG